MQQTNHNLCCAFVIVLSGNINILLRVLVAYCSTLSIAVWFGLSSNHFFFFFNLIISVLFMRKLLLISVVLSIWTFAYCSSIWHLLCRYLPLQKEAFFWPLKRLREEWLWPKSTDSNVSRFPMVLWVWWVAEKGKKRRAAQAWLWELQSQSGGDISNEH